MTTTFLTTPLDAIVFDCDGTLSSVEGIVALAKQQGCGDEVAKLTSHAMGVSGLTEAVYAERLRLVAPTRKQVEHLGQLYIDHLTLGTHTTLAHLSMLDKPVYIISAGLKIAVTLLAKHLFIPASHVYAVDLTFDDNGQYVDFDHRSPLSDNAGKRKILQELQSRHPRIALIGDGKNDLVCQDMIERFIGFGGHYRHPVVETEALFYTHGPSLTAILPYCLTEEEYRAQVKK